MPERPSILYVDCSYGFGGAIKSLGLTLRGAEVDEHVLTSQPPALVQTFMPEARVGSLRSIVNYHRTARLRRWAARRGARWLADKLIAVADVAAALGNSIRLRRLIRQRAVRLIHLNNGFRPLEAFLAARATDTPVVVHLRDFPGPIFRLSRLKARCTATAITVSDAVAAALRERTGSAFPVVTIHDPVDLERIAAADARREDVRARLRLAADDIAIGIFGRVIPWKGQKEFVLAAASAMRSDNHIRAVVVGDQSDGGERYYRRVQRLAADSGLGSRFAFTGFQQDVEGHYAAMDIVVHASITPEPFGMVVPEAMAAGKPVIASAAGGPCEVIEPGVTGLLTPPGDVAALAAAMLALAADPAARRRFGEAGRAAARARFGIAANAARVEAVYRSVLSGGEHDPALPHAESPVPEQSGTVER
jgi:glycosyltransferase involved in cell wall biosynthesis